MVEARLGEIDWCDIELIYCGSYCSLARFSFSISAKKLETL